MTSAPVRRSIGHSIPRVEDHRLLLGAARFFDDISEPGMLHAAFVRSPIAHGRIRSIEVDEARDLDGVHEVITATHLDDLGANELPVGLVLPDQRATTYPVLARDRVVYAGQPIAVVLADDRYLAEDGAELVQIEVDEYPAVTDPIAALDDDAPILNDDWGTNIAAQTSVEGGSIADAFEAAAHVIEQRFRVHRHGGSPIEARGAVATYDQATDELTAWISTQAPHHTATLMSEVCGWPENRLRVIAPDVGGAFGTKEPLQAEELIVCLMAHRLSRPVKWGEDRREHFLSTVHSREQVWDVELAAAADGRILGVRGRVVANLGGHLSNVGLGTAQQSAGMFLGPYAVEHYQLNVIGVVTNKVPSGAYRGFGLPEAAFVIERLVDDMAGELELDRVEVRHRNFIPSDAFPYTSASGFVYDSGDYSSALDRALGLCDHDSLEQLRSEARARGRYLGMGFGSFVMAAGLAPSSILGIGGASIGGYESATVRMDPTGKVTLFTGTPSQGQGHATTLAQACAEELGVDPGSDVVVKAGDSEATPYDPAGAIGSRVGSVAGGAVILAARVLREKIVRMGAYLLEANEVDIRIEEGRLFVSGDPDHGLDLSQVAKEAWLGHRLPPDMLPGLEAQATHEPENSSYPFSAHVAIVEIDPETGTLEVRRYVVVNDCGTIINPSIVEGQIRGGVVQGIGGALLEELAYDANGQLLTTSFMDYLLPTASEVPDIEIEHGETPSPHIPGGMKGVGEAGALAPMAVIGNAVADALRHLGVRITELPFDLDRVVSLVTSDQPADGGGRQ